MQVVTSLWYDTEAEEAAKFYTSLIENSKITKVTHYGEAGREITKKEPGSVLTVNFELNGQNFTALNGGPDFKFNEAASILINCGSQEEIDRLWEALTADGGEPGPCGWLKDKYGLSWQIAHKDMDEMMGNPDDPGSERAMAAMLKMGKIDVQAIRDAYDGK